MMCILYRKRFETNWKICRITEWKLSKLIIKHWKNNVLHQKCVMCSLIRFDLTLVPLWQNQQTTSKNCHQILTQIKSDWCTEVNATADPNAGRQTEEELWVRSVTCGIYLSTKSTCTGSCSVWTFFLLLHILLFGPAPALLLIYHKRFSTEVNYIALF